MLKLHSQHAAIMHTVKQKPGLLFTFAVPLSDNVAPELIKHDLQRSNLALRMKVATYLSGIDFLFILLNVTPCRILIDFHRLQMPFLEFGDLKVSMLRKDSQL